MMMIRYICLLTQPITGYIREHETIFQMKNIFYSLTGLNPACFFFICNGHILNEDSDPISLHIPDGSRVFVVFRTDGNIRTNRNIIRQLDDGYPYPKWWVIQNSKDKHAAAA